MGDYLPEKLGRLAKGSRVALSGEFSSLPFSAAALSGDSFSADGEFSPPRSLLTI
jgi:hypothetical protein